MSGTADGESDIEDSARHEEGQRGPSEVGGDADSTTYTAPLISDMPEDMALTDRPGTSADTAAGPSTTPSDPATATTSALPGPDGSGGDNVLGSQQVVVLDSHLPIADYRNIWRFVQLTLYATAFVASVITFGPLLQVSEDFSGKCVLYADVELWDGAVEPEPGSNVTVAVPRTVIREWPDTVVCDYCIYSLVCASIYAFICCWFYLMCGTSTAAYASGDRPELLVIPSLLLGVLLTVLAFTTSILITQGLHYTCTSFTDLIPCEAVIGDIYSYDSTSGGAADTGAQSHLVPTHDSHVYTRLLIAKITSWVTASLWAVATAVLAVRVFVAGDFPPVALKQQQQRLTNE